METGNILAIDDRSTHRKKIVLVVTTLGYNVATVSSATAVILHLQQYPVDRVLLDIEMPEADGYSFYGQFYVCVFR